MTQASLQWLNNCAVFLLHLSIPCRGLSFHSRWQCFYCLSTVLPLSEDCENENKHHNFPRD
jgi:hypothetical protein